MAAASQGDDDDERRALEVELAAELAALSARDVGFDDAFQLDGSDERQVETSYVRLDLGKVLQQVIQRAADASPSHDESEKPTKLTSWELLLASVERTDREFFQPCHENLKDIRTSILDVKSSPDTVQQEADVVEEQSNALDDEEEQPGLGLASSQPEQCAPVDDKEERVVSSDSESNKAEDANGIATSSVDGITESSLACEPRISSVLEPPDASDVSIVPSSPEDRSPADDQDLQKEFERIAKQHEARESRRLKTQARYQKEREEAERLLQQLQDELEAQEKYMEMTRREAQERSRMANEELRCRQYTAAQREALESEGMALADEASLQFATELARIQDAMSNELGLMTAEDQAERLRMKVERETQHEKHVALVRGCFSAVLLELKQLHVTRGQIRDLQSKRERRECVQMRAEEAYARRLLAETRASRELQERERTRALMVNEDKVATAREASERREKRQEKQREESCRGCLEQEEERTRSAWAFHEKLQRETEEKYRHAMAREEERSRCAWEDEEKEREKRRLQVLTNVSTGFHHLDQVFKQHELVACLAKWRRWSMHCIEEDRVRSEAVASAAKRIQMWHRSCRQRLQFAMQEPPLLLEDFSDGDDQPQVEEDGVDEDSDANQDAARRLQSTFRGFHVRRKFANALALAQAVGGQEEGDCFDAVDLDDLIQLPPELVDGWEDPVLLPVAILTQQRQYPPQIEQEEERPEHVGNNEVEEPNVPAPSAPKSPPKEQNLAATLWSKMKRVKQRQQHTQQERQRQQDPAYRVQKLLNRKPNARQNGPSNNQISHSRLQTPQGGQKAPNLISWSSTGNVKKKPKVKLPSLVERLRRQTMAER